MDKLKMSTPDLSEENIKKIANIFPSVITEKEDENGDIIKGVDFDLLRQVLSKEIVEGGEERYRLDWPGKKASILKANTPITDKTLRPVKEGSVDFENTENLYIEGDNFQVLKLLQESYLNKVKMIYIDPPYNTGKDFVYKDNFTQDKDEYNEEIMAVDEEGNKLFKNTETNGRFHSDWLSMMYERLVVAKDLLKEDGVIFISIDDNEAANIKKVCDEIFGENNFETFLIWQKTDSKIDKNTNAKVINRTKGIHEYIACIFKSKTITTLEKIKKLPDWKGEQKNVDKDIRGNWQSGIISFEEEHEKEDRNSEFYYSIKSPSGKIWTRHWFEKEDEMIKLIEQDRIYFGSAPEYKNVPRKKTFENEEQSYYMETIIRGLGTSSSAKDEILNLFENRDLFDTPKPEKLIREIIRCSTNNNDIILDFFAGSSTTAHAVMQLNAEDGGNRKYIMVQLPEETDEKSEAYKAGYKNICEIGKERIRRAAKKIQEDNKDKDLSNIDFGFRVFRLDSTNMRDVYYNPKELSQDLLSTLESNVKEDRSPEDLLTQVLLDLGLELSHKIEFKDILGNKVFFVEDNVLVACFDDSINFSIIDEIAKVKPLKVVFKDASFKDDKDRINVEERFKRLSPETGIKVI